jgi:hypothetical protein
MSAKVFGPDQIVVNSVYKQFTIDGREEAVHALRNIDLSAESEIYPIRQVLFSPTRLYFISFDILIAWCISG